MANVHQLETVTAPVLPVDAELVVQLRKLTEMAERGEFQGLAYATIESTGAGAYSGVGAGFIGQAVFSNVHTMIGAVVLLQQRLLAVEDVTG